MNLNYPFTPRDKKIQEEVLFLCCKKSFYFRLVVLDLFGGALQYFKGLV